jgi:Cu-Zn family superoxide dismutase
MMKHVSATIALLVTPVAVMSGCSKQASNPSATTTSSPSGSAAQKLTTHMNTADGKHVADATIDFTSGYATVTVETVATGILTPGFHGVHINGVGKCEANSVSPTGGQAADFASAGDIFQAPGHTGQPASGDLPPLLVRSNGAGKLVATSDGFTQDQIKGPEGSSIVLLQGSDMAGQGTAESDRRVACGVLSPASAMTTSVSTSTVTTTTVAPVPPATVTETPSSTSPTSSMSTSTSTSTVTVTPSTTTTTVPPGNMPGTGG